MVGVVTALGRTGLQDWLIQRISAIFMALYTILMVTVWICMPENDIAAWERVMSMKAMRIVTFLAILSLVAHVWVGLWTVTTDYLKVTFIRMLVQIILYTVLLLYIIWSIQILWG